MRHRICVAGILSAMLLATAGGANAAFVRQSAAECKPEPAHPLVVWFNDRGWVNTDFNAPHTILCPVPDDERISVQNITLINVHGSMDRPGEGYVVELRSQNFSSNSSVLLRKTTQFGTGQFAVTLTPPFDTAPPAGNFNYIKITLPRWDKNPTLHGIFYASP